MQSQTQATSTFSNTKPEAVTVLNTQPRHDGPIVLSHAQLLAVVGGNGGSVDLPKTNW